MKGLVIKKQADKFTIETGLQNYICTARGILKKEGVFVGDNVEFNEKEKQITKVLKRKNKLIRPPIANLDTLVILITTTPPPDYYLLDKMLLFCAINNIKPIICHSKSDLENNQLKYLKNVYGKNYEVVEVSSLKNKGITSLKKKLTNQISAVAGQSGVGKSALINAITKKNIAIVGDLSAKIERGKQTTRHCELFKLTKNTFLADTAGFSSLDEKFLPLKVEEIPYYYPEFIQYLPNCKFSSCTHITEPQCAVKKAVQENKIDQGRYERYLTIFSNKKNTKQ